MQTARRALPVLVVLVFAFLIASCSPTGQNSNVNQGADGAVEDASQPTMTPTAPQPTPTVDLAQFPQSSFVIDGYDDDWSMVASRKDDEQGDQFSDTPDIAGVAARNNLTHFYISTSFFTKTQIQNFVVFIDTTERDWDYQIMLDPARGTATISPFGPTLAFIDAPEIAFVWDDVLEIRIPLSLLEDRPVTNFAVATSAGSTWFGDQVGDLFPEIVEEVDLLAVDAAASFTRLEERPGHVWLFNQQAYADYALRSFLQNPIKIAWGPDGYMYIADWLGKHIVRMGKDGSQEDLGLWSTLPDFQNDGPTGVTFDRMGSLYFFTHSTVYKTSEEGEVERLDGITGSPIGDVSFDADNTMYYTDLGGGNLYRWTPDDGSTLEKSGMSSPEYMAFGLDGVLYITLQNQDRVMKFNPATGDLSEFVSGYVGRDPMFITADPEGDIWIRALRGLLQFSPDGTLIPFTVDGEVHEGGPNRDNWITSAGIAFDDEGALWVASYNSLVLRLESTGTDSFTRRVISEGFQAYDIGVDPDGNIYATDNNTHALLKIHPGEEPEVVVQNYLINNSALAISENGEIYLGLADQRIARLESDGSFTTIANFFPLRMIFGTDGALYAIDWSEGRDAVIVRISGPNQSSVWLTEVDGTPLGNGELSLGLAADGAGIYILKLRGRDLLLVGYDGQGSLLMNLVSLGVVEESGGAGAFGSSPLTGMMYFIPHGPYRFYEIAPSGEVSEIAGGLIGDPSGMAFSPDGMWLYVSESGAIDIIPITNP